MSAALKRTDEASKGRSMNEPEGSSAPRSLRSPALRALARGAGRPFAASSACGAPGLRVLVRVRRHWSGFGVAPRRRSRTTDAKHVPVTNRKPARRAQKAARATPAERHHRPVPANAADGTLRAVGSAAAVKSRPLPFLANGPREQPTSPGTCAQARPRTLRMVLRPK